LNKRFPAPADRLVRIADQMVDAPYRENARMFARTEYDCVTFCEQALANALASSWDDYFQILARLRYRDGQIPLSKDQFVISDGKITPLGGIADTESLRNRNNFIISEWNKSNSWCLQDITKDLGSEAIKPWIPLHHIARPKAFYAKQGLNVDVPDVKVVDAFIPREAVPKILPELKPGDIVEVIRGSWEDRFCDHMGILVQDSRWHDPDGTTVYMLHAVPPKARRELLPRFLRRFRDVQGFKFLRLRQDVLEAAARESQLMQARINPPAPQN
jgi:hypothetical protein